jgi:hypothetical protein
LRRDRADAKLSGDWRTGDELDIRTLSAKWTLGF